jgi:hypothetical protein
VKKPIVERLVSCRSFHTVRGFQYCRLVAWPPRGRLPNLRILVRSFFCSVAFLLNKLAF